MFMKLAVPKRFIRTFLFPESMELHYIGGTDVLPAPFFISLYPPHNSPFSTISIYSIEYFTEQALSIGKDLSMLKTIIERTTIKMFH